MMQPNQTTHGGYQDRLLLRPREVAVATGLSRSMVYELINRGELPAIRVGTTHRRPWIQFEAMLDPVPPI